MNAQDNDIIEIDIRLVNVIFISLLSPHVLGIVIYVYLYGIKRLIATHILLELNI